jgi:serine/threonine protein kinase
LARGGFSTVWQARQESLDRLVAVKVDHRPLSEDKERRRFLREAGAAGRLSGHPGIVTVHDAGILTDGRPYLVMDLCTGGSLTRWLKPEGRRDEKEVRDVGVRIADALAAAHSRGVLHRDVKPANILIDSYGNPGLADFGLAAMPEPGVELSVTLEGMTPAYAPTEVFYLKPPTERGDVYALAATLYALLDGKPPRWPDTGTPSLPELLQLQREPVERLPHVDDDLMDVLLGALDDDPERRPTAAEFRDQLQALTFTRKKAVAGAAAGGAASGAAGGAVAGGRGVAKRRRRLAAVLAAAVVAALVLVSLFTWGSPGRADPGPVVTPSASTSGVSSSAAPSTEDSPSSSPSSSSPSPSAVPAGFVECSAELGEKSFCVTEAECWTDLYSYANLLTVGQLQDCEEPHLHQTFAAGLLDKPVNRQSDLEDRPEVRALCTYATLDKVLASGKSRKDWPLNRLAPQVSIQSDNFFRCLFSNGSREGAIRLKLPD